MLPIVNMLWIGTRLGPIHQLAMTSFVAAGHRVRLYAYDDISNVPQGIDLADGEPIMPREFAMSMRSKRNPSFATASDFFRLKLQGQGAGLWADTDIVCLRPIDIDGPHIFGWESTERVNNAVLSLPPESPIIDDVLTPFCNWGIPYWVPLRKRMEIRLRRALRMPYGPPDFGAATFGPIALTAALTRHRLLSAAQPREVFYPFPWAEAEAGLAYAPGTTFDSYITENSKTLHLWNEALVGTKPDRIPSTSALGRLLASHGL